MALSKEKAKEAFEFAAKELRAEIALFWQRSLFFWGFIAAAFVAYGSMKGSGGDLTLAISCFGLVCGVAWSLLNRGSKYWQIHWEKKLKSVEEIVFGEKLYSRDIPNPDRSIWGAARYSVTKLTVALSDFATLVWVALAYKASPWATGQSWSCLEIAMVATTIFYVFAMLIFARSNQYQ